MASKGELKEPTQLCVRFAEDQPQIYTGSPQGSDGTDAHDAPVEGLFDAVGFRAALSARLADVEQFVAEEIDRLSRHSPAGVLGHGSASRSVVDPSGSGGIHSTSGAYSFSSHGSKQQSAWPTSTRGFHSTNGGAGQDSAPASAMKFSRFAPGSGAQGSAARIHAQAVVRGLSNVNVAGDIDSSESASKSSQEERSMSVDPSYQQRQDRITRRSERLSQMYARANKMDMNMELKSSMPRLNAITEMSRLSTRSLAEARQSTVMRAFNRMRRKETVAVMLESVMGVVILLNCAVIGVSTDLEDDWDGWFFVDVGFAAIFLFEVVAKVILCGCKEYFCGYRARWHFFELTLVVMAWFEVYVILREPGSNLGGRPSGNFSLLRLLRLMKVTRLARICDLRLFSDLMVMVRGTLGGIRTLFWSTLLISVPLYAFCLVFRETLGSQGDAQGAELFSSVPLSFFTVFRCTVAAECTDSAGRPIFAIVAKRYGWGYAAIYCMLMIFMTFGLFNVIVAIFVENVVAGAKTNSQLLKRQRLSDERFMAKKMIALIEYIVESHSAQHSVRQSSRSWTKKDRDEILLQAASLEVTPHFFKWLMRQETVATILRDLDVSDEDCSALFETLDVDCSGTIDIEELCDGISKLRGDARRSDVIQITFLVQRLQSDLAEFVDEYRRSLNDDRVSRPLAFSIAGRPSNEPS